MSYILVIPLAPHSKERPRARIVNNRATIYTPPKTERWEDDAACYLRTQWGSRQPIDRQIAVIARMVAGPLQATSKAGRRLRAWRTGGTDIDNEAKSVLDALVKAGVLKDDRCVVQLIASKVRHGKGGRPCVEIVISDPIEPPRPIPGPELQALVGDAADALADPSEVASKAAKLTTDPVYGGEYSAPKGPDILPRPYEKK